MEQIQTNNQRVNGQDSPSLNFVDVFLFMPINYLFQYIAVGCSRRIDGFPPHYLGFKWMFYNVFFLFMSKN